MLTPKQEKFCQCIVSGMSGKDSYITAYENKSNDNTAYKEAMKLLDREDIQARIKDLRKPLELQAKTQALSERDKKKAIINERIQACITKEDDAAIARYIDILNKMDAEYISVNVNKTDSNTDLTNLDLSTLKTLSE